MNIFSNHRVALLLSFIFLTVGILSTPTQAQNKVIVIPMPGGQAKPLKNIVTVAKANGNFTDPVAAVNSINDASMANPYLVVIGPGVYNLTTTLKMKPFVSIAGSGQRITMLQGSISSDDIVSTPAIISLANRTTLSDLTVANGGQGQYSIGVEGTDTCWTTLERIEIHANSAIKGNYGLAFFRSTNLSHNHSHTIRDAYIAGYGGEKAVAIYLEKTDATRIENCKLLAFKGTSETFALQQKGGGITVNNVEASAQPASGTSAGIQVGPWGQNSSGSLITMNNVTAISASAQYGAYGVFMADGSYAYIKNSWLNGRTAGIRFGTSHDSVINTRIDNGVENDLQGNQCRDTYDVNLADVDC